MNYLQLTGLDKKIAYSIQKTTVAMGEEKSVGLERYTTVDCKDIYTILDSNINYKRKIWESYTYSKKNLDYLMIPVLRRMILYLLRILYLKKNLEN